MQHGARARPYEQRRLGRHSAPALRRKALYRVFLISLEKVQGGKLPWCADGVPQGAGQGRLVSTYESSAVELQHTSFFQTRGRCINSRTWLTKMLHYARSCWATLRQRAFAGFVLLLSGGVKVHSGVYCSNRCLMLKRTSETVDACKECLVQVSLCAVCSPQAQPCASGPRSPEALDPSNAKVRARLASAQAQLL